MISLLKSCHHRCLQHRLYRLRNVYGVLYNLAYNYTYVRSYID